MNRLSKAGLIVLAVLVAHQFFSTFDNSQVYAEPKNSPKPVNIMNTPLQVSVTNPSREPVLETFDIYLENGENITATVTLPADSTIEMLSAYCGSGAQSVWLDTYGKHTASLTNIEETGVKIIRNRGVPKVTLISSNGQQFLQPIATRIRTGTKIVVGATAPTGQQVGYCDVTITISYTP